MKSLVDYGRRMLGRMAKDKGATMVEYGLMVAFIAIVCLLAVALLGTSIRGIFEQIPAGF